MSVECRFICTPRSSIIDTLLARAIPARASRNSGLVDAAHASAVADRDRARTQHLGHSLEARRVRVDPVAAPPGPLARSPRRSPRGTTRRCPGARRGERRPSPRSRCASGRSRSACARGPSASSLITARARAKPCDCHGFLPTNTATSQRSKSPCGSRAEHLALHPELAGLLLRQRVGAILHAERLQRRIAICATQMVSLSAAAVVEDALAAVLRADRCSSFCAISRMAVRPVDRLVRSVGPPAHRRAQAVRAVLVVVQPLRLLAHVALRDRMGSCRPRCGSIRPPRDPPRPQFTSRRACAALQPAVRSRSAPSVDLEPQLRAEGACGLLQTSRFRFAHRTSPSFVLRRGILLLGSYSLSYRLARTGASVVAQ